MNTLQAAQQAYDNRQPDDMDDYPEHQYTGPVEIDGILFDFDCGTLETVEMHGDMFDADIDRTDLIRQADIKAQEYWIAEREEMSNEI